MAKIELLKTGKYSNQLATADEVAAKYEEIRAVVEKFDWWNRFFVLYGRPEKVEDFMCVFADYKYATHSTKQLVLAEINRGIRVLNEWVKHEEEPKEKVRFLDGRNKGQTLDLPRSICEVYVEIGFAERV